MRLKLAALAICSLASFACTIAIADTINPPICPTRDHLKVAYSNPNNFHTVNKAFTKVYLGVNDNQWSVEITGINFGKKNIPSILEVTKDDEKNGFEHVAVNNAINNFPRPVNNTAFASTSYDKGQAQKIWKCEYSYGESMGETRAATAIMERK